MAVTPGSGWDNMPSSYTTTDDTGYETTATQQGYGPFNALVWERLWGKDAGYVLPSVQVYRTSIGGDPAIAVQIGDMWRCAKVPNPGEYAHKIKNAWNPATLVKR
jgi:hypothetical protein